MRRLRRRSSVPEIAGANDFRVEQRYPIDPNPPQNEKTFAILGLYIANNFLL